MEESGSESQEPESSDPPINNQTVAACDKNTQQDYQSLVSSPEQEETPATSEDAVLNTPDAWESTTSETTPCLPHFPEFNQSSSLLEPPADKPNQHEDPCFVDPTALPSQQTATHIKPPPPQDIDSMNSTQQGYIGAEISPQQTNVENPESDELKHKIAESDRQMYLRDSYPTEQMFLETPLPAQQTYIDTRNSMQRTFAEMTSSADRNLLRPTVSNRQTFVDEPNSIQQSYLNSPFSGLQTYVDSTHSLQSTNHENPHSSQETDVGTSDFIQRVSDKATSNNQQQPNNTSVSDQQKYIESLCSTECLFGEIPTFHQQPPSSHRKRSLLFEEMPDFIDDKLLRDVSKQLLDPSLHRPFFSPLRRVLRLWDLDHLGSFAPRQVLMEAVMDQLLGMMESKELLGLSPREAVKATGVRLLLDALDGALPPDPLLMHQASQGDSMAQAFSHAYSTSLFTCRGYNEVLAVGTDSTENASFNDDDKSCDFAEERTGTENNKSDIEFKNEGGAVFGGVSNSVFGNARSTDSSRNIYESPHSTDITYLHHKEPGSTRWRHERYESDDVLENSSREPIGPCICTDGPCTSCSRCYPPLRRAVPHSRRRPFANERKEAKRKPDTRLRHSRAWPDSDIARSDTSSPEDIPRSSTSSVKGEQALSISIESDPQSSISSEREQNISENFSSTEPQSYSSYSGAECEESSKSLDSDKSETSPSITENQIQSSSENENTSCTSGSDAQSSSFYSESDPRGLIDLSESSDSRVDSTFSSSDRQCLLNDSESERHNCCSSPDTDHRLQLTQSDVSPSSEFSEPKMQCTSPDQEKTAPFTEQEMASSEYEWTPDSNISPLVTSFGSNVHSTQINQSVCNSFSPFQSSLQEYQTSEIFSRPQIHNTNTSSDTQLFQSSLQYLPDQPQSESESMSRLHFTGSSESQMLQTEFSAMSRTASSLQPGESSQEQFQYLRDLSSIQPQYQNTSYANQIQDSRTPTSLFKLSDTYSDSHSQYLGTSTYNLPQSPHPSSLPQTNFYSTGASNPEFQISDVTSTEQSQYSGTIPFPSQQLNDSSEPQIHPFSSSSADRSQQSNSSPLQQFSTSLRPSQSAEGGDILENLQFSLSSSVHRQENAKESPATLIQCSGREPAAQPQCLDNSSVSQQQCANDSSLFPFLEAQNQQSDINVEDPYIYLPVSSIQYSEPSMPLVPRTGDLSVAQPGSVDATSSGNNSDGQPVKDNFSSEEQFQNADEPSCSPPDDSVLSRTSSLSESNQLSAPSLVELLSITTSLEELQFSGVVSPPELNSSGPDSLQELQYSIPPSVRDIWDEWSEDLQTGETDLHSRDASNTSGMVSSSSSSLHPSQPVENLQGATSNADLDSFLVGHSQVPPTYLAPNAPGHSSTLQSENGTRLESSTADSVPSQNEHR